MAHLNFEQLAHGLHGALAVVHVSRDELHLLERLTSRAEHCAATRERRMGDRGGAHLVD